MNESGLTANDIHSVEMIGEGSRIPAVIELSQEVFGQERGSRTLNSAEACARGCSLMAAMILPHFHVASFQIEECNPYPVDVSWSLLDNSMKTKTLFPGKSNYPSVKSMTFDKRKEPMQVAVSYNQPELLVEGIPHFLSRYQIDVPEPKHEKFGLKLRVKVDQNCIPGLDTAELVEEYQEEKKIPVKAAPPPKTEKKEGEEDAKEEKQEAPEQTFETKLVTKTQSTQINFKWEQHGLSNSQIEELKKVEDGQYEWDNKILALKEMKNNLESYVYEQRNSLDTYGDKAPYIKESEKPYIQTLNDTESWLYGDGENATKEQYEDKLTQLRTVGEVIHVRYVFHDLYSAKKERLSQFLQESLSQATSIPDDSHITKEEKEALIKLLMETQEWFNNTTQAQDALPKNEDPVCDINEFDTKLQAAEALAHKTLNKPKPKPKTPPKEEKKEGEEDAKMEEPSEESAPKPEGEANSEQQDVEMEQK